MYEDIFSKMGCSFEMFREALDLYHYSAKDIVDFAVKHISHERRTGRCGLTSRY